MRGVCGSPNELLRNRNTPRASRRGWTGGPREIHPTDRGWDWRTAAPRSTRERRHRDCSQNIWPRAAKKKTSLRDEAGWTPEMSDRGKRRDAEKTAEQQRGVAPRDDFASKIRIYGDRTGARRVGERSRDHAPSFRAHARERSWAGKCQGRDGVGKMSQGRGERECMRNFPVSMVRILRDRGLHRNAQEGPGRTRTRGGKERMENW